MFAAAIPLAKNRACEPFLAGIHRSTEGQPNTKDAKAAYMRRRFQAVASLLDRCINESHIFAHHEGPPVDALRIRPP